MNNGLNGCPKLAPAEEPDMPLPASPDVASPHRPETEMNPIGADPGRNVWEVDADYREECEKSKDFFGRFVPGQFIPRRR
jgi:hypothetical protein